MNVALRTVFAGISPKKAVYSPFCGYEQNHRAIQVIAIQHVSSRKKSIMLDTAYL